MKNDQARDRAARETILQLRSVSARFFRDHSGATALVTALGLVVLAGFSGLAIDGAAWLSNKRKVQDAADQAAYSTVVGVTAGESGYTNALALLKQAGYGCGSVGTPDGHGQLSCSGSGGLDVQVNTPPTQGNYTGDSTAWEVIVKQPQQLWLASLFLSSPPKVVGRAVGLQGGNVCILALDTRSGDIHSIFGGTSATVKVGGSCQVADNLLNDKDTDSVDVKTGANVDFQSLYMRVSSKCDSGNCNGTLTVHDPILYSKPAIVDPYARRTIPTPSGHCDQTNLVVTTATTLDPGTYCGTGNHAALSISGSISVTLRSGTYILDGKGGGSCSGSTTKASSCVSGNFVTSGATVTGSGVTIVLTTSTGTGSNIGNMNIQDGSSLSLTAPAAGSGDVSGIAIWQDPRAPNPTVTDANKYTSTTAGVNLVQSGGSTDITGLVYFPSQGLFYTGGSGGNSCTQIVAFSIDFKASAEFNYPSDCASVSGMLPIGAASKLAE